MNYIANVSRKQHFNSPTRIFCCTFKTHKLKNLPIMLYFHCKRTDINKFLQIMFLSELWIFFSAMPATFTTRMITKEGILLFTVMIQLYIIKYMSQTIVHQFVTIYIVVLQSFKIHTSYSFHATILFFLPLHLPIFLLKTYISDEQLKSMLRKNPRFLRAHAPFFQEKWTRMKTNL